MIKKLDKLQGRDVYEKTALAKINEVIDVVNSIVSVQEKLIDSRFVVETNHEAPAKNVRLEKIMLVYELASTMITPKSYNWKEVAKMMYEIANQPIKELK